MTALLRNPAHGKQHARLLKRLAVGPAGDWERRPIDPDWYRQMFGDRVSDQCLLITRAWVNNHFAVQASDEDSVWGVVTHLWIRRHDGARIQDHWRTLQAIKNELGWSTRVAVEVYPPDSDVVDAANMYHLWILPAGFSLPFGLKAASRVAP